VMFNIAGGGRRVPVGGPASVVRRAPRDTILRAVKCMIGRMGH